MPPIKTIHVVYEEGMDVLKPHIKEALEDMMNCFPACKDKYPIKILGNWYNGTEHHESVRWYVAHAKLCGLKEGRRGQISTDQYMDDISSDPYAKTIPQWQILITKEDLYGRGVNWCLGRSEENKGCIISIARFLDSNNKLDIEGFKTVLMHEFGHIIGLTNENRVHTEKNLGAHCTNDGCIMQQRLDGDFREITQERLRKKRNGQPPICQDCIDAGNKFFNRQQMAYNFAHGLDLYQGIIR